jgi:adenylate kinase family enzyme
MGIAVYGFPAVGKTTMAKKYNNVFDLEKGHYAYLLTDEQKKLNDEEKKGIKKMDNPDYPQNYFDALIENLKKYDYVFISHKAIKFCIDNNIPYWIVYPKLECKQEYLQRMKERGNQPHFIEQQDRDFEKNINECEEDKLCQKRIILQKGETLEMVFKRMGLI